MVYLIAKKSSVPYFICLIRYTLIASIVCVVSQFSDSYLGLQGYVGFVIGCLISAIIGCIVVGAIYWKTDELRYYLDLLGRLIHRVAMRKWKIIDSHSCRD